MKPVADSGLAAIPRRVVSLAGSADRLFALCDDGTIWTRQSINLKALWFQVPPIPSEGRLQ